MKIVQTNEAKMDALLLEIREAQIQKNEAEKRESLAKAKIKDLMIETQTKTKNRRVGDKVFTATIVVPDDVVSIDNERLKDALEPEVLVRVTKRVIDNSLLEAEMDRDPDFIKIVEGFATYKSRNPYIRFSEKEVIDDVED